MKDNMVQTMVVGLYIVPMIVCLVMGLITEWFDKPKGERVISIHTAVRIIGSSVAPFVNMVVAVMSILIWACFSIEFALDKTGLSKWWATGAHKALFKDSK